MSRAILTVTLVGLLAAVLPSRASAFVYWVNSEANSMGVQASMAAMRTGVYRDENPLSIAIGGDHLYWTQGSFASIGRANLDGTDVEPLFLRGVEGGYIAADEGHIYWEHYTGTIGRANLDGSEVDEDFITLSGLSRFTVSGNYIYWVNYDQHTIGRASLDGKEVDQSFIGTLEDPGGLAVGEGHIYWFNGIGTAIGRANLDGSDVQQEFITGIKGSEIAVGAGHLFWTTPAQAKQGFETLGRANVDGSDVQQEFIIGADHPSDIAVSGNAFELKVTKTGDGLGTVASSTPGIDCGLECGAEFEEGETVTLTPSAAAGSEFVGWTGACSGSGVCKVTMTAAQTVGAEFSADHGFARLESMSKGTAQEPLRAPQLGSAAPKLAKRP